MFVHVRKRAPDDGDMLDRPLPAMIPRRIPLGPVDPTGVPYYLWCIVGLLSRAS